MQINGSDELYDALAAVPVPPIKQGLVVSDAQFAAMKTASELGHVIVLTWDADESAFQIRALNIDAKE